MSWPSEIAEELSERQRELVIAAAKTEGRVYLLPTGGMQLEAIDRAGWPDDVELPTRDEVTSLINAGCLDREDVNRGYAFQVSLLGKKVARALTYPAPEPSSTAGANIVTGDEFDVFLSHASEDKGSVVLPLAALLEERGARVWLDKQQLTLGDDLRQKIDDGLRRSRFGVVILSPAFFEKAWPELELSALLARQTAVGGKVILPVWHKVGAADINRLAPTLAGKLAASTEAGLEAVADQIAEALRAAESGQVVTELAEPATGVAPVARAQSEDPQVIHDRTIALLTARDSVGLSEALLREQRAWEATIRGAVGQAQPSGADAVREVWERLLLAIERRLATLMPIATHDRELFESEVRGLARSLERLPTSNSMWSELPVLATAWLTVFTGAWLIRRDDFEGVGILLQQTWTPKTHRPRRLVAFPGAGQKLVGDATAPPPPQGQSWISPHWQYLTQAPAQMAWLVGHYSELGDTDEFSELLAIFDLARCLNALLAGDGAPAYFAMKATPVAQFAYSLHGDETRRREFARAVGVELEEFDDRAAEALLSAHELHWNLSVGRVVEALRGER